MRKEATTVREIKSVEVQLEGLNLVAYELKGKQFVSAEINGEYFSSFDMVDMTAGQVAYDIKSVYHDLSLADIRNAVLNACDLMPKEKVTDDIIYKTEKELIEDLEARRCFYKNEKGFNRILNIARKKGYKYALISPITVLDDSTQRVEFLKDNTIDERRAQGRARLYGAELANPITIDTLINEVVLPEALVDDSKVSKKPSEYVIIVVEENNTFYLTEIYSEDFLTMREKFESSGCKVFKYTDKRFIELVKMGTQYIK